MSIFWRHSFGSPPVDEIKLTAAAADILAEGDFDADPAAVLSLCKTLDGDTAAAVLFRYLVTVRHKSFVTDVEAKPATAMNINGSIKLLIVPGYFYREHPDIGAGGDSVLAAGEACGFEVGRVPTNSLGTVVENVGIIRDTLTREQHPEVWLVSFSKGAAEIRLLMQQWGDRFPPNVRGWISVSGLVGGTPLATMKSQLAIQRLFYRGFFPLLGTSFEAVNQMRHDHPFWQTELVLPEGMRCVHIVGVPLLSHVETVLVKRHRQLSSLGINDGMSLLESTLAAPGEVYPLWGADHFLRTPALSPLLYRLLHWIAGDR